MKKRIVFVVQHLTVGGSQTSLISALNAIDYDKNAVTLYSREAGTALIPQINSNVKIIVNSDKHHYYLHPISLLLLFVTKIIRALGLNNRTVEKVLQERIYREKIKREHSLYFSNEIYDVAVAYMQGNTALFVKDGIRAKRKIVFFHGSIDEKHDLHEKVFTDFDAIVGVSELVSIFLRECYPNSANKVVTLENYVDAKAIREKSLAYSLPRRAEFTLCTCGRIATDKILDRAIRAAKIIKEKGFRFHWYFIGDGPFYDGLTRLIEDYGLNDEIEMTGAKDNPFPYYINSDAFVICSDDEALPMTLIEAKILCLPMISTKTSGGFSLVKQDINGLLVDFSDEAVAEAIILFISHPEMVDRFKKNLKNIDYSKEFDQYKKKLAGLIEG